MRTKRGIVIGIAIGAVLAGAFGIYRYARRGGLSGLSSSDARAAKIMLPAWSTDGKITSDSSSLRWIVRQCRQPFLGLARDGKERLMTAKSLREVSPGHWLIEIRDDLKWRDGTLLQAGDFGSAWKQRQNQKAILGLDGLESVSVESGPANSGSGADQRLLRVEFSEAVPSERQKKILASPWLAPLHSAASEKAGAGYTIADELTGSCFGPYDIFDANADRVVLSRVRPAPPKSAANEPPENPARRVGTAPSLIDRIEVRAFDASAPLTFNTAKDLIMGGTLSYARGIRATPDERSRYVGLFRGSTTGLAYYLWASPGGAFQSAERLRFLHQAMNRGELVSASVDGETMRAMHRLVPISIQDDKGSAMVSRLGDINFESVEAASRTLGIETAKPVAAKGFKATLKVPEDPYLKIVGQIFSGRLRANYLVNLDVDIEGGQKKSGNPPDLILFGVPADDGLAAWARGLVARLATFSGKTSRGAQVVAALKRIEGAASANRYAEAAEQLGQLDREILGGWNLVPIGQKGFEYLVDPKIANVQMIDDPEADPDFSMATFISQEKP